ncbi:hypothetical protein D9758_010198 [Tetrapyrgos nigripes]|uniref:Uncharacterized protein n=1 Tax=Tetrapyrgos nigripes TaxID=182062 RepID=A0A8H5FUM4_9AGAR|nr:hypothetical protein D9758_010198 [Tetrapyrgos nigripes]
MANAGLHYDQAFLDALPTTADVFTLTPGQFDDLHHSHLLSHPPDSTLFPFLHGIEGDNELQNVFFASEGQQCTARPDRKSTVAKIPRYRAMTWVVCEEDLDSSESNLKVIVHRRSISSYSGDSESYDAEEDECDDDSSSESDPLSEQTPLSASYVTDPRVNSSDDLGMDVDISYNDSGDDSVQNPINPQPRQIIEIAGIGADEKHMHPVQHRPLPNKAHIPTSGYSSTEESSETDEIQVDISPIPSSDFDEVASHLQNSSDSPSTPSTPLRSQRSSPRIPQSIPPIFTSTFRASELLRRVAGSAHGNKMQKHMPIGSAVNLVNATSASGSANGVTSSTSRWQQTAKDTAPISDASGVPIEFTPIIAPPCRSYHSRNRP